MALGALGGFAGPQARRPATSFRSAAAESSARSRPRLPDGLACRLPKSLELRVVPGLYFHRITDESAQTVLRGYLDGRTRSRSHRLSLPQGRPLDFRERKQPFGAGSDPSNIVDAGYPYGSIQVPGGLEPIILHRDAVSGGGYAMIGTVISADMDRIAQMQPNNMARFVEGRSWTARSRRAPSTRAGWRG